MKKFLLNIFFVFFSIFLIAQTDTVNIKKEYRLETVFSIHGLLINRDIFPLFLKKEQVKITKFKQINQDSINKYPYLYSRGKKDFWEIEITSLIVLNNRLLKTKEEKDILKNYKQSDIIKIYTLGRFKTILKYGFKKGKNGALIIKTK